MTSCDTPRDYLPRDQSREREELQHRLEEGEALAQEFIVPRLDQINVQPPTDESLAVAAEVGVRLGRETYTRGLGGGALNAAFLFLHTEYSDSYPRDQNFNTLQQAATEAFKASGFKFIEVDFSAIDALQPAQ